MDGYIAYAKLNRILDDVMLRRTKIERQKDLGLPPRFIRRRSCYFNEEEKVCIHIHVLA